MKKVNYLLGLVLLALLCADGFVVGQGMTFYPAITSDEQSALLTGAVQTNDTRNVALGGNLSVFTNSTTSELVVKDNDASAGQITVHGGTVSPGILLRHNLVGSNRRNWSVLTESDSIGDFVIKESSNSSASPSVTRLQILSGGTVVIGGTITSTNAVNAPIKAVTGSSQTNLTFWTGSAASYAALASTNASTIYFITN